MSKSIALSFCATVTDAAARILAVVTLDQFNKAMAAIIAVLSVVHLIIKIRKETRTK